MNILLIFTFIIWCNVAFLIFVFCKKYHIVDAICVNYDSCCEQINIVHGFICFEYKNDFGYGAKTYYGQARAVREIKEGKRCKISITKDYNGRVIVCADVIKLVSMLLILSILLVLLYVLKIDVFMYAKKLRLFLK